MPIKAFLALSRVLAMLSGESSVHVAGLKEKRLLNHERLGERIELGEMEDPAELGPDDPGV